MCSRKELYTYTETSVISYIIILCSGIAADRCSDEVDEGKICQESVQEIMSSEDREDSIEDCHTYTTTGILLHYLHV